MTATLNNARAPTPNPDKVYRDYDQKGLDAQYNNQAAVPHFREHLRHYRELTTSAKASLTCIKNLAYGDGAQEILDIYRPERTAAPVQVFIHGGAWQQLGKDDSGLAAPAFVDAGAMLVALNFDAAPQVSLDTMVHQVRRAIAWLWHNIDSLGGDRDRIYISGHSSGSHLASQCLTVNWRAEFGCPQDVIKGITFVSGLGDLEPVRLSYRNEVLKLDEAAVKRLSLIHQPPAVKCPMLVAYASADTHEFQRQTREVGQYWGPAWHGLGRSVEIAGRNHYDVLLDLANPHSELFRSCARQMNLSPTPSHQTTRGADHTRSADASMPYRPASGHFS